MPTLPTTDEPRDRELLTNLRRRIETTVGGLLAPGEPVALVNFPNHANAGDSAIWLGEESILRQLGSEVVYRASWASFDERALRLAAPGATVLINGGGNFGDVYMNQESTRERVLSELRDHRVVQMPQSIWFRDPANLDRVRRLVEGHGSVTLLLRDDQSFSMAQESFAVPCRICPDMALALGPRPRPVEPDLPILWIARRDPESAGYRCPEEADVCVVDWLEPVPWEGGPGSAVRAMSMVNARLTDRVVDDVSPVSAGRCLSRTFSPLARHWVDRGCRILARGRVVVTDRLHGHLLAALMGIPHVLVENGNGKLGAHHRTWFSGSSLAQVASSPSDALERARELVAHA